MTKMATTPIYGKKTLNVFSSRTKRPMALGLGMKHWGCGSYQICTNDKSRLTLTYFMARSNLIPNVFIWENLVLSIKSQADLWPFIQGHSFGLPHTYLNIRFSEITGLFDGLFIISFKSLDQNVCNPHIW